MILPYLFLLLTVVTTACGAYSMPFMPAGSYLTPKNRFIGSETANGNAPICRGPEPCGYYAFDSFTRRPLKWIPSWCRCKDDQDCVYSGQNNKMRIYTHACLDVNSSPDRTSDEEK